jgi:uncharacterized RDD family membrane protein YckC
MIGTHYGGFGRRAVAFLIDNVIIHAAVTLVFILGLLIVDYEIDLFSFAGMGSLFLSYYITAVVMNLFYFTYFHGTIGQTVGKRIMGLKVLRLTGEPLNLGVAFLRWIGYIISGMIFYLGFLWIAFDRRKQGWHDKIAGTCVIKTGPVCEEQPDLFSKMP